MTRLGRLLQPRSIAVVGATDRPGAYGANTIANLRRGGFEGRLVGIHPTRDQVLGIECLPSLAEAGSVDAVVIATPAPTVCELVSQAAGLGCGGCVVYAAGFAESGRSGLQRELVKAAGQMPIIGPNCNGVVSIPARAAMWGDAVLVPATGGGIGLITESGNVGVIALGHRGAQGLHTVVSTGNSANVAAPEVLQHLAMTEGIAAVALYLESDGDGRQWCEALAACVQRGIHVVVLKAGRSARGAAVGQAHTAAMVGDHGVFSALATEAGGVMVEETWQLLETARALAGGRRDPRGAAIVTCSGADAAIGADLAADLSVELADLSTAVLDGLRVSLPDGATPANPLDHTAMLWADEEGLARVTELIGQDPQVGHLIYVQDEPADLTPDAADEWRLTRDGALLGARRAGHEPMLVATTPGQAPIGAVAGLGNTLRAVGSLQRPAPDPDRLRQMALAARPRTRLRTVALDELQAKQLATRFGIAVPDGEASQDADNAVRIACRLGWPVVAKALDPSLAHKSEIGGVVLGLTTPDEVRTSAERLLGLAPQVLIEQQVPPGIEILVTARRDGVVPTLTVGLGGIWTEALGDVVVIPLPAEGRWVRSALSRLRGASVLTGSRGQEQIDLDGLCLLAERVGTMLLEEGLDLVEANPVILGSMSAVAVDLLVR